MSFDRCYSQNDISIHAPARGATRGNGRVRADHENFNPRSREGSDGILAASWQTWKISIHAPARGATKGANKYVRKRKISIHAPARGATRIAGGSERTDGISIHAPARGATRSRMASFWHFCYFNPRSREGSDTGVKNKFWSKFISIHAPARGATAILSKIHPMFLTISHNASSFSSFPFHSFLPHLLNSSTFCALFQVRISRAFSVYYRFAPKKSTPDLQLYHVLHRYVQL